MNIAIIGAGNAGCAHAFKFSEAGHQISLVKTSHSLHEKNFEKIQEQKGIWAIDSSNGNKKSFQKLHLITRDIDEGLKDADIVIIMTQSLQHDSIAQLVAPRLRSNTKVVFIIPGNLGSLFFYWKLKGKDIILAEGESTPFDARIMEPGIVNILFKNVRNAVAFLPVSRKDEGMKYISQLTDTYGYYRNNIVESALHNPNLVVHTIGVIMSANRIELMKGEFWMYKEAFTPSIWNLVEQLDNEKNDVIEKSKGERISYLDACKFRNEKDLSVDALSVFRSYAEHGGPKGPESLNTRYLYEDVPMGLGTLSLLGKYADVATKLTDSLITIASFLVKKKFYEQARTLEDFGLRDISFDDFVKFINS
jgi:opine dehydrogenase